ncbi:hypothetical protein MBGDF03_00488 [Thermoplasmatales archaeon SCGC AB-540-F20]|nr:hypothetical protein MBGDF03_00488 [Thermoplasmatales archaeon SCGC AB-540-F20]
MWVEGVESFHAMVAYPCPYCGEKLSMFILKKIFMKIWWLIVFLLL